MEFTSVPLATGERLYSRWDFREVMTSGIAVARPDLSHADGISEVRRIAAMAETYALWVALWGAGAVRRYHPDGHLLHILAFPAPHPTSVCLPPDDNRLFVTTARYGVTNPTATSGAVLGFPVPVGGTAGRSWRGRP
ncbi:hypothetical protein AQI96_33295 [Streptomyces canus]|nr:hypothetical protein AQI96_33295 [Streptomyces canus]